MKTCIKISIVGFLICAALQSISGAGFSEQLPPDRLTDSAKQAIELLLAGCEKILPIIFGEWKPLFRIYMQI